MSPRLVRFPRICLPKAFFFLGFVLLWLVQPAQAQSQFKFSFGDAVPSFQGGYYIDGIPSTAFIDTGENRFQKAGRVFGEAIGGVEGIGDDLTDIAFFPFREPLLFGAAALGVGALVATDYPVTAYYQDKIEPIFAGFTPPPIIPRKGVLSALAVEDQYLLAGIGLTYAYGVAANDERAQVAALLSSKAVAYSYLVSHLLLKPAIGRIRPARNLSSYGGPVDILTPAQRSPNPYNWGNAVAPTLRPSSFGTSFPSFHYTLYFSVARVYSGVYDNSILPYVAAGILSVSNIRGHNHWVSDMAAGALIGTVIGQSILNNYSERKGLSTSFTPVVSSNGVGAQFTMRF
ncbi:phosphatase PAP2 family protein [Maritimibacter sp. UBA3975]|uniref:phosphatase PAP2 family protein n=1 Tax=Maritimibacter sp. UBA3975 TaxID=1946833 RepID=UPI000C0922AD|nr:phosphatase PAP2 family protein [Maritimibacter sp. UBA3975]MAM61602.1 phosphoesterase [Maritimibacter sp.]|tara:strand:- start:25607 stop:26641 length:1035 start_codon:yes stop_codon:yes gene_type:complete